MDEVPIEPPATAAVAVAAGDAIEDGETPSGAAAPVASAADVALSDVTDAVAGAATPAAPAAPAAAPETTATTATTATNATAAIAAIATTTSVTAPNPLPTPGFSAVPRSPASFAPSFSPLLCVVDFHHARGPEVEMWFGASAAGDDPAVRYDWPLLPFMALSDGAHASTEDFSYFTLLKPADPALGTSATSLFGISCTRQIDAAQLLNRPSDVTRSTVQKAVVIIADSPQFFGMLRERLSIVTKAWFDQREFTDVDILRRFQEALAEEKARGLLGGGGRLLSQSASDDEDRDQYLGMSLRELVHEFRWQTLVLLKCCLLQPKMLFFGSRCERLCMMQFSLVSLIPGLLRNLQDCAGPELDNYAQNLKKPTSLRTSDRSSLLTFMGLPLQIFGKGSLFGPYTPLQQLDILADVGTKSYIVGSTNSLLLQQRDRYSDILINLDEKTVNITSSSLRTALQLSAADRRWIDFITQEVNSRWDEANPGQPKDKVFIGSEEFIRLQFEEYLLALVSSVKYHNYTTTVNSRTGRVPTPPLPHIEGDPSADFGVEFIDAWSKTGNFKLWNANTDTHLFEFREPRHPCAGGLSIDDIQRRIAQQVQDLHLDERFSQGREVLGRNIAAGREKASTLFNKFYADMEALRESQRRKAEEARQQQQQQMQEKQAAGGAHANGSNSPSVADGHPVTNGHGTHGHQRLAAGSVDLTKAQQTVQSASARATAYMSSWAAWAGEKRKGSGWGRVSSTPSTTSDSTGSSTYSPVAGSGGGVGGSWSLLGGNRRGNNRNTMSSTTSDASSERGLRMSVSSFMTGTSESYEKGLPATPATPAVQTPATFTSASGRPYPEDDFPPDLIIRNLDEERPPLPPQTTPVPLREKLQAATAVVFSVPAADETGQDNPRSSDNNAGDVVARSEKALPPKADELTTEKPTQLSPRPTAPTGPVGSKVMLLP